MVVLERLKSGNFNIISQKEETDGSLTITLTKRGDNHIYRMKVKNLYGENEEVLSEEVTEV